MARLQIVEGKMMHMISLETAIAVVLAYLIGSISSAVVVCRVLRLPDPRTQGSKNPGATNVLRFGGKKAAVITLAGDVVKGMVPVVAAIYGGLSELAVASVALAAFLGHLYPVFFRFEGGKGVATAFGCILVLSWPAGLIVGGIWLLVAMVFRYSSLAALAAAIMAPMVVWYFANDVYALALGLMSLLLIYRHKKNIYNLWKGKEKKIGKK